MRLTVLGNSSRYLAPLGAGSSYLLEGAGLRILLDAGHGTQLKLATRLGGPALDAVVVSHFHVDSVMDLVPVMGALDAGTPVFMPEGAQTQLEELLGSVRLTRSDVENADVRPVKPGSEEALGDVTFRFGDALHGCPCVSVRIDGPERSLAYLADTGPHDGLANLARGVDLVMAHTLILDRQSGQPFGVHNLSAGEAGRIARQAGARRLALSHAPFYLHANQSMKEAAAEFGGEVFVLSEAQSYDV